MKVRILSQNRYNNDEPNQHAEKPVNESPVHAEARCVFLRALFYRFVRRTREDPWQIKVRSFGMS